MHKQTLRIGHHGRRGEILSIHGELPPVPDRPGKTLENARLEKQEGERRLRALISIVVRPGVV